MDPRYTYTDAAGVRSGPYSEVELERLAEIGGIDWTGSIRLEPLGRTWRVSEVGWLAEALGRARSRGRTIIEGSARTLDEEGGAAPSTPPPDAPPADAPPVDPPPVDPPPVDPPPAATPASGPPQQTTPPTSAPWPLPTEAPRAPSCARATYIVLGVLPAFVGVFGLHNLVAGYITRGVVQLVLSILTVGGLFGTIVITPCCCFGIPMWGVLFVWMVFEVATVTRDAYGVAMR